MAVPDADTMRRLVRQGKAMPAPDQSRPGRFPIRNGSELSDAIRALGRVPAKDRAMTRRFVMKRARALGATDMIPDTWRRDGTLKE